jgi:multiple antibiotic resistance protein
MKGGAGTRSPETSAKVMLSLLAITKAFISIVAIVNPIGAIPLFLSLTAGRSLPERNRTAKIAALSVGVALILAAWTGNLVFEIFMIRLASFRVGGGILLLMVAISMLHAAIHESKQTAEEAREAQTRDTVAVVPLAIPLLAGPGAMSLVIVDARQAESWQEKVILNLAVVLVAVFVWIALRSADVIGKYLGATGMNIVTRMMGLILSAVAIELIAAGALDLFPGLRGPGS